ncbi:MAG: FkbM family methyltransferase [Methanomassiliicoccales archaeon]|nr:MAG: FkbM family methyltransferase [Methanomassiliicoccales archaeon]
MEQLKNKKKIKIKFVDFHSHFNINDNMFTGALKKRYDVEISDKPDYIFYSAFGCRHLDYDCIRIFYTGENIRPDFNICDYGIGFDWMEFGDRYLRWPNYRTYGNCIFELLKEKRSSTDILYNKKYFCNFIYSDNMADSLRVDFFKKLSEYKFVDALGSCQRNKIIPELEERKSVDWAKSKIEVMKHYKFTIAMENSSTPGYTTEKIVHAMAAETIPIYWGNPHIDKEFNPESFIWVRDKSDFEPAIEEIIKLDQNDERWKEKMNKPWIINDYISSKLTISNFESFLYNIFDQDLSKAQRRSKFIYGINHEIRVREGYETSQGRVTPKGYRNCIQQMAESYISEDNKYYDFNGIIVPKQSFRLDSFLDIFYPHILGLKYSLEEEKKYYSILKDWLPILRYLGDRFSTDPKNVIDWNKSRAGLILPLHGSFYFNEKVKIETGDVVFDVGAAPGDFASTASAMGASHIYCFEPNQAGINKISLLLNYEKSITIIPKMLGANEDINKNIISLDNYIDTNSIDRIDFIKIDVEGMENDVLLGAKKQ